MDMNSSFKEGTSHLDSHAGTSAGGSNFVMMDRPEEVAQYVDVSLFSDKYKPLKGIPVASCATEWTSPLNGRTYILVFHQMLFFGDKLKHSLLCPNQMRDYGNQVEDTPRQYEPHSAHGITIMSDDNKKEYILIPLNLEGPVSYFDTRRPTEEEMKTSE